MFPEPCFPPRSRTLFPPRLAALLIAVLPISALLQPGSAAADPEYRLDPRVVPIAQSIHLDLDAGADAYTGSVVIELEARARAESFDLHSEGQEISELVLTAVDAEEKEGQEPGAAAGDRSETIAASFRTGDEGRTTVTPGRPLEPGSYRLEIRFTAPYNTRNEGLYKVEAEGEGYLFTQFQDVHARKAFPCWDEPSYKIPYRMTLRVPESHEAVANTPATEVRRADGWKTVRFRETPPTPSYLLAIATGPLDFVEFRGMSVPGRLYAPRGKTHLAGLALEVTPEVLRALEEYFGSPYPYAKLDFLAVPDKGGAMENPGAVTYNDGLLLLEPGAGPGIRRIQAAVIAHELAHMWFGDWVTMAWWDDLWLNESFASWMGDKVAHELYPELGIDLQHRRSIQGLMDADTRLTTRPVRRTVESTLDISEDLGFAYGKGQTILSMVEQWIGEGTFREGVIAYLEAHAWGNARAEDLWRSLDRVSGQGVTAVMRSFLEQSGLPLVAVGSSDGGRVKLRQTRFLRFGVEASERTWSVPVSLAWGAGGEVHRRWVLLDSEAAEVELGMEPDWVFPDAGAFGYHRWQLPQKQIRALAGEQREQLSTAERVAFLGNATALLQAGQLPGGDYLDLVAAFSEDPEPVVLQAVFSGLGRIESAFLEDGDRQLWARVLRRLLSPRLAEIGIEPREGESEAVALLRPGLVTALGRDGRDPEIRRWARERTHAHLHEGAPLSPAFRGTAISLAAAEGDEALFHSLRARYEAAATPAERNTFLSALGRFEDPKVREIALAYVLEGPMRVGELMTIPFVAMSRDDASRQRVYAWLLEHWSFWQSRLPENYLRFFPQLGASCSLEDLERVHAFFEQEEHRVTGTEKTLAKLDERVRDCVRLRSHQRPSVLESLERLAAGSR